MEASHVITDEQIFVAEISTGMDNMFDFKGVYKNVNSFRYQEEIGNTLASCLLTIPNGVLIFFTSYSIIEKMIQRWKFAGIELPKRMFLEPKSSASFEDTLNKYKKASQSRNGAVFLAVHRGKLSEGIDFSDELCRGVILIGIPYPSHMDLKIIQKKGFNNRKNKVSSDFISGNEWYEIQAFRSLNQAIGRCLRHRFDWGAILLIDSRYTYERNLAKISKWVRQKVQKFTKFEALLEGLGSFIANVESIDLRKLAEEKIASKIMSSPSISAPVSIPTTPLAIIPPTINENDVSEIVAFFNQGMHF